MIIYHKVPSYNMDHIPFYELLIYKPIRSRIYSFILDSDKTVSAFISYSPQVKGHQSQVPHLT